MIGILKIGLPFGNGRSGEGSCERVIKLAEREPLHTDPNIHIMMKLLFEPANFLVSPVPPVTPDQQNEYSNSC